MKLLLPLSAMLIVGNCALLVEPQLIWKSREHHAIHDAVTRPFASSSNKQHRAATAASRIHEFRGGGGGRSSKLKNSNNSNNSSSSSSSSTLQLTISLVKSIVGSGILALPAGVAVLGSSGEWSIISAAIVIVALVGAMNAFFFQLVGDVCQETKSTSFRQAWDRTVGGSESSSRTVSYIIVAKTALSCLVYSMILADSFQALGVGALGLSTLTRTQALAAVTVTGLIPLCLLKNLKALTPFSLAGLMGIGFTIGAVGLRWFDGSYAAATPLLNAAVDAATSSGAAAATTAGKFYSQTKWPPVFSSADSNSLVSLKGVAVLVCTLASAFVAHYNGPRFHSELREKQDFPKVTYISYAIAAMLYASVGLWGYLTFGAACQGNILNNYVSSDPVITLSRAAVAFSILVSYPLPFVGFRDGMLDALDWDKNDDTRTNLLTVGLLAALTLSALLVNDIALVLSVGGGTLSTAVSSIFPTLMYRNLAGKDETKERWANVLMVLSVAIGVTGVGLALQKAMA